MSLIIIIHTVLVENIVFTPDTVGIGGRDQIDEELLVPV